MLEALPGGDLIAKGLEDLGHGHLSVEALLVAIGGSRLRRAGLVVPHHDVASPERRLYESLAGVDADSAHARYNALIRRLVGFERALECAAP